MSARPLTRTIVFGLTAVVAACGCFEIVSTIYGGSSSSAAATTQAGAHGPGGSPARSGPAAGGAAGTVGTVSSAGFTLTTSAGQKVTVSDAASTTYRNGTTAASASAITAGQSVLVLGTASSTTITVTQVTVEPAGSADTVSSASVIPFRRGAPAMSRQAGQIPAAYREGSGAITSGSAANKATEAALAAYPGGVVDRVVKLSNGDYEVHYIGISWPHHVFVSQDFTIIGAE